MVTLSFWWMPRTQVGIYMYTIRVKQSPVCCMAEAFDHSLWDGFLYAIRDGKATTTYDYTIAGQLASLTTRNLELKTDSSESFLWDGLALIRRSGNVMFNDVLGTTLGTADKQDTFAGNRSTAFGEGDTDALFTGKPYVEGLGHAFLLRNYRADLGKWQTADPLGHPDGWNNFAYCNGRVTSAVDWMGGELIPETHDQVDVEIIEKYFLVTTIIDHTFTCGGTANEKYTKQTSYSTSGSVSLSGYSTTFSATVSSGLTEKREITINSPFSGCEIDEHEVRGKTRVIVEVWATVILFVESYTCGNVYATVMSSNLQFIDRVIDICACKAKE